MGSLRADYYDFEDDDLGNTTDDFDFFENRNSMFSLLKKQPALPSSGSVLNSIQQIENNSITENATETTGSDNEPVDNYESSYEYFALFFIFFFGLMLLFIMIYRRRRYRKLKLRKHRKLEKPSLLKYRTSRNPSESGVDESV